MRSQSRQRVMTRSWMNKLQPLSRNSRARCSWSSYPISYCNSMRVKSICFTSHSTLVWMSTSPKQKSRRKFQRTNRKSRLSGPKWIGLKKIKKRESVGFKESKTSLSSRPSCSRSTFLRSKRSSTSYRWWLTRESPGQRSIDKSKRKGRPTIH